MAAKPYHVKMRPELLAKYKPSEARTCFGSKPEGSESAYHKGCESCEDADTCYDATKDVHAAIPKSYWKKSNERYSVKKDNRGPYVNDVRAGYNDAMSAAEICALLNKYEELKKGKK